MKRFILIIFAVLLIFSGCSQNKSIGVSKETITKTDVLKIRLTEATSEKLAVEIINKSKNEVGFDEKYFLEFEKNGEWHRLEPKHEEIFTEIAYVLEKESTCTWGDSVSRIYGKLPSGKYRLIKYFTIFEKNAYFGENMTLAAQFRID